MNILGHMQQGGRPTPFDRNMGTKMAAKSFNWLVQQLNIEGVYDKEKGTAFTKNKSSCCLLGLRARAYQYQPIADLKPETDFQVRYIRKLEEIPVFAQDFNLFLRINM